jgi:hypothetical protein
VTAEAVSFGNDADYDNTSGYGRSGSGLTLSGLLRDMRI